MVLGTGRDVKLELNTPTHWQTAREQESCCSLAEWTDRWVSFPRPRELGKRSTGHGTV